MNIQNSLQKDDKTGYMFSTRSDAILPAHKIKFIESIRNKKIPNISFIARSLGFDPATIHYHLKHDPLFKKHYDQAVDELTDDIENKVFEYAHEKQNFMDRMAWLRAHRPDKWDQKATIEVNHNMGILADNLVKRALGQEYKSKAVDAEIVDKNKS